MECLPELLRRPQISLMTQFVKIEMNVSVFSIRELIETQYLMRQIIVRCASEYVTCGFARAPRKGISTYSSLRIICMLVDHWATLQALFYTLSLRVSLMTLRLSLPSLI